MKNLVVSFLSTGVIQLANLVTGILAARLLLPEGRGELALLLLWATLVADLGSLGINTASSYLGARRIAPAPKIFAATVWLVAAIAPVLMAAYAVVVPLVFDGRPARLVSMAWVYMALIPIHLYSLTLVSQFQGEQRFGQFNLLRCAVHLGYLVYVLVAVATSHATVQGFAWAFLCATASTGVIALAMAARAGWISLAPDLAVIREMLRYGIRVHVGGLLYVANRKLDQLLISVTLAATDLGLYVVAVTVSGIPMLIVGTTDLLAFPKMSEQPDDAGRVMVLGRYLRVTLCLMVPGVALIIAIAPELIGLLFGKSFVPASTIARILVMSSIGYAFRVSLATYLRAGDRIAIINKVEAAGVVVTVVTLGALVPAFGTLGAAIAQLLAMFLPAGLCVVLIRREQDFSVRELLTPHQSDIDVLREALARLKGSAKGPAR